MPGIFCNREGQPLRIHLQSDGEQGMLSWLRSGVELNGGQITDDVKDAHVIVILNRATEIGKQLIRDHAVDDTSKTVKGVVDERWISACVGDGSLRYDLEWGGHRIRRDETVSVFEFMGRPQAQQTPGMGSKTVHTKVEESDDIVCLGASPTRVTTESVSYISSRHLSEHRHPIVPVHEPSSAQSGAQQNDGLMADASTSANSIGRGGSVLQAENVIHAGKGTPHLHPPSERLLGADDDPPPRPPQGKELSPQNAAGTRHRYTDEDKRFVIEFATWLLRQNHRATVSQLSEGLYKYAPHHSKASWSAHITQRKDLYTEQSLALKTLILRLPHPSDDNGDHDGEAQGTPNKGVQTRAVRARESRTNSGEGEVSVTIDEFNSLATFLAGDRRAWLAERDVVARESAWAHFATEHPTRSKEQWIELYSHISAEVEHQAQTLLQAASQDADSRTRGLPIQATPSASQSYAKRSPRVTKKEMRSLIQFICQYPELYIGLGNKQTTARRLELWELFREQNPGVRNRTAKSWDMVHKNHKSRIQREVDIVLARARLNGKQNVGGAVLGSVEHGTAAKDEKGVGAEIDELETDGDDDEVATKAVDSMERLSVRN